MTNRKNKRTNKPGTLRVIAGQYRHRVLNFPEGLGVRPTHDRVRETLFNWLAPSIEGAVCLDLFAGSGALGFEALSRGASRVVMVESERAVSSTIKDNAAALGVTDALVNIQGAFPAVGYRIGESAFDILFLDPPYNTSLLAQSLDYLRDSPLINNKSLIYFEAERSFDLTGLVGYEVIKHKSTKSLQYGLLALRVL